MRLLQLLALPALPLIISAAKPSEKSAFSTYFPLQASSLAPFEVDVKAYDELTAPSRDYSFAILLTAVDSKYMCKPCQDFESEWELIGKSWQRGDRKGEQRVLFGTMDFDKEKAIFQRVSHCSDASAATDS